jgi:hypothetical protein
MHHIDTYNVGNTLNSITLNIIQAEGAPFREILELILTLISNNNNNNNNNKKDKSQKTFFNPHQSPHKQNPCYRKERFGEGITFGQS